MRVHSIRVFAAVLIAASLSAAPDPSQASVASGIKWLASTQGPDGGWGQDGGATSHGRQGQRQEANGNDVANTASAVLALLHAGHSPTTGEHRSGVRRGVEFLLANVEKSREEGLAITEIEGTQIQRKLGPYIDTFLTSMLLSELDGQMGDHVLNRRVRASLEKCVRKIEGAQLKDGSWNHSGGWAPILGTSMASRSLYQAKDKGVKVTAMAMDRVEVYTQANARQIVANAGTGGGVGSGSGGGSYRAGGVVGGVLGGIPGGVAGGVVGGIAGGRPLSVSTAGAGVALYDRAQTLEQLSRTPADREKNAQAIKTIANEMARPEVVAGFGSMGGEEYFSYLNVSDSLRRVGGERWRKWNSEIKTKLVKLQNGDGTWAGHHCITGRVAVTSAAILTLTADRQPAPAIVSQKR
ncbi:MAG: prenyltransferase/squalene oxidase repeat-containing protein [Bryobacteraceae bacterium]